MAALVRGNLAKGQNPLIPQIQERLATHERMNANKKSTAIAWACYGCIGKRELGRRTKSSYSTHTKTQASLRV